MQKLVTEYLERLNRKHKRRRKVEIASVLLVVIVVSSVVGVLTQYGFALTGEAKCGVEEHQHGAECYQDVLVCGQEEGQTHQHAENCYQPSTTLSCGQEEREGHQHGDGCYQAQTQTVCGLEEGEEHQHTESCFVTENVLVCGLEESEGHQHTENCFTTENVLVCGQSEEEAHQHTDACRESQLACEKEEHTHTEWCRIDTNADVEDVAKWDAQYANMQWKDAWGEDLVMAAEKQIGYKESEANYWIAEDGSHKGYTRYGQFAGNVYADWDAAFVNFCLHYAKLADSDMFVNEIETGKWHEKFVKEKDHGYLTVAQGYEPKLGDLVFFDREGEETAAQMGIVSSYNKERNEIKVIEGNNQNEVRENTYDAVDEHIFAYLQTTEMERAYKHLDDAAGLDGEGTDGEMSAEGGEGTDGEQPENPDVDGEDENGENADGTDAQEEQMVELSTDVGDITITLRGPQSSFEEGKEYSIIAEKIVEVKETDKVSTVSATDETDGADATSETDGTNGTSESKSADETGEVNGTGATPETMEKIEEAVNQIAEEKEKEVKSYQAFDIKLMLDGEEVQPLGPVEVKFSGHEVAKAVEDEATEVSVVHVDENSGEATDMEAVQTEEKDVVIETEHFSVYVYVNLADLSGKITVTVQHWGENIETLVGSAIANGEDSTFDMVGKVKTTTEYCAAVINSATGEKCGKRKEECTIHQENEKNYSCEIYSADELEIPNEYYTDVLELSKLCSTHVDNQNYRVTKVWVMEVPAGSADGLDEAIWPEGTYQEYSAEVYAEDGTNGENRETIELSDDSIIRFWYEPIEKEGTKKFDVTFYDYDITDGVKTNGTVKYLDGNRQGINSTIDYSKTGNNKLYVGQRSGGNTSEGNVYNAQGVAQQKLSSGFKINGENGYSTDGTKENPAIGTGIVAQGIVANRLDGSGNLQFNVNAPTNLFSSGIGSTEYKDYKLGFKQNGDTYTLQYVYDAQGNETTGRLTEFQTRLSWGQNYKLFANEFWPLDTVPSDKRKDPLLGKNDDYKSLYNNSYTNENAVSATNDFGIGGHNWYFGMTYEVNFTIGDYTGPMEYYFRGDDDFWLFVDGQLIVDLGGIHAAASQSVDLRQVMISKGLVTANDAPDKVHTLKVFFMERGASGSCCYMQFTLPQSQPVNIPSPDTMSYTVKKEWEDNDSQFRPEEIVVRLLQKNDKSGVVNETAMTITLNAKNNWSYTWEGLPKYSGTDGSTYTYSYSVEEINLPAGYRSELETDGKTLTNMLDPIKIAVEKEWQNEGAGGAAYRPGEIKVRLYANGEPYKFTREVDADNDGVIDKDSEGNPIYGYETYDITLDSANNWKAEFVNLPQYYYRKAENPGTGEVGIGEYVAEEVVYSVVELDEKGNPILNGGTNTFDKAQYKVTYGTKSNSAAGSKTDEETGTTITTTENGVYKDTLTITNTLLTEFRIVKVGTEGSTETTNPLVGAEFTLKECNENGELAQDGVSAVIISDANGLMISSKTELKDENGNVVKLESGKHYLLKETKAPVGYTLSAAEWMLSIGEDMKATVYVKDEVSGKFVLKEPKDYEGKDEVIDGIVNTNVVCVYYFNNEVLYALPSAGGSGIYWYMLGGVLLMAGAAFITYRNKRKGVLKS